VCRHDTESFSGDSAAPRLARAYVTRTATAVIGAPHAVIANLGLVCSELVTNAVQAGSPEVTVDLDVHHSRVEIAVTDAAPGMPQALDVEPSEAHGRGLRVVAALSQRLVVQASEGRKTVSAQLVFDPPLTEADFRCDTSA